MSDSLWPHGLQSASLLCPWNSPGKNTRVGCHALLQGTFPTQGSNSHLLFLALAGRFFITSATWKSPSLPTLNNFTAFVSLVTGRKSICPEKAGGLDEFGVVCIHPTYQKTGEPRGPKGLRLQFLSLLSLFLPPPEHHWPTKESMLTFLGLTLSW